MNANRWVLAGWTAFAGSGVLYLIAGFRDRDPLVIVGSIVWLIGVGLFLRGMRGA